MNNLHGTFQLNKEERIHSWYPYLAGFSAEFVREKIREFNINENSKIFDPFAGVGTTLLVAKMNGIYSEGVEINPFASFVADTKLYLEHDIDKLQERKEIFLNSIKDKDYNLTEIEDMPKLLQRAFSPNILKKLRMIRNMIYLEGTQEIKNLFLLALISILKEVSNYKNFSPYLEPRKEKIDDAGELEYKDMQKLDSCFHGMKKLLEIEAQLRSDKITRMTDDELIKLAKKAIRERKPRNEETVSPDDPRF